MSRYKSSNKKAIAQMLDEAREDLAYWEDEEAITSAVTRKIKSIKQLIAELEAELEENCSESNN